MAGNVRFSDSINCLDCKNAFVITDGRVEQRGSVKISCQHLPLNGYMFHPRNIRDAAICGMAECNDYAPADVVCVLNRQLDVARACSGIPDLAF